VVVNRSSSQNIQNKSFLSKQLPRYYEDGMVNVETRLVETKHGEVSDEFILGGI
jgi:hypothetical protein